jgi:hypothetical protein
LKPDVLKPDVLKPDVLWVYHRDDLGNSLVLSSIVLVMVLPVLLGPVLVSLLHCVLYVVEHVLDVSRPEPRPGEDTSQEVRLRIVKKERNNSRIQRQIFATLR